MAYSDQTACQIAAGGAKALTELLDLNGDGTADTGVLETVIGEADAWIDGHARRLYGDRLPFNPVPALIAALSAEEVVYRLRHNRRVATPEDEARRTQREATLAQIESGRLMPVDPDPYPIGSGAGTPVVVERAAGDAGVSGDFGRDSTRGFWRAPPRRRKRRARGDPRAG